MLTYFAKYVNLNSKVCQHTFFRHFWLLLGKISKYLLFNREPFIFSSHSVRRDRRLFYPQNPYAIPPFLSLSINTYELINRKGKVNQLTWSS